MFHRILTNLHLTTRGRVAAVIAGIAIVLTTAAVVHAATTPDFALTASPSSQTINSGSAASYVVALAPSNGFTGAVTLSAGSLPKGTAASWTVGTTTTSGSSVSVTIPAGSRGVAATLTIGGGQPSAGTYDPTITATSGSLSHKVSTTLVIVGQNAANFGLSVSPTAQTLVQGSSATESVSISRANWSGAVALGPVSGLPSGITATLAPASTTGSSAALSLTASASAPSGLYTVTLNGSATLSGSTSSTRSTAFTVLVRNATTTTVAAPATDPTNVQISAGSISSTLAGATSGATGTITFKVFGPQAAAPTTCSTGGTTVGSATVNGSGTYHPGAGYQPSAAGTYWWYASYSGESYDGASASTCGPGMASTVVKNTTTTAAGGPASSAATAQIAAGAISSSLSGATGAATGTITFKVFGPQATAPSSCSTGGTTVGSATVSGNGTYHPTAGFTPAVGGTYWWYASYSGDASNSASSSACGVAMASTAVQDFTIGAAPSSVTALTGGTSDDSDSYSTTITPVGGFAGTVALTVPSGLPAGTTATFNPASTSGSSPSSSTLTIDVGPTVTPGTYTLTVQGKAALAGATITRTTQVTLVIQGSQPFGISGNVPGPLYPGAAAQTFQVTLSNPNSFPITVTSLGSVGVQPVNAPGCLSSWFQVTLPSVPSAGISVGAGSSVSLIATAQMLNVNTSQDACQGKQLTLVYTGSYTK